MVKAFKKLWINHWRDNLWLYLLVLICLIIGVVLGAISVKLLTVEETRELGDYLSSFLVNLEVVDIEGLAVIRQALYSNFKTLFLIWFLGLTVLGAPLILILLGVEGFTLGFTAGFLIKEKGLQGILLALMALTPANIILIPTFITAGVVGITFSVWLVKGHQEIQRASVAQQFFAYSFSMVFFGILIMIGGLFEGYCSPSLMKLIVSYFN